MTWSKNNSHHRWSQSSRTSSTCMGLSSGSRLSTLLRRAKTVAWSRPSQTQSRSTNSRSRAPSLQHSNNTSRLPTSRAVSRKQQLTKPSSWTCRTKWQRASNSSGPSSSSRLASPASDTPRRVTTSWSQRLATHSFATSYRSRIATMETFYWTPRATWFTLILASCSVTLLETWTVKLTLSKWPPTI